MELNHLFSNKFNASIVILDEIDHLVSQDQSVLYKLFEWAKREKARFVLIGIANAIDLTTRLLPRLEAKGGNLY